MSACAKEIRGRGNYVGMLTIDWDELEQPDSKMAAISVFGADRRMTWCSSVGDRRRYSACARGPRGGSNLL
jgi:hypothetical protein